MKRKSEYFPPLKDEGEVMASWGIPRHKSNYCNSPTSWLGAA
ncbi:MAG: hypothetical protein ACLQU3_22340 [Limisphaerales bacterium]